MSVIQLPRNVQFLYEEHLARLELAAFGCVNLRRRGDEWNQLIASTDGHTKDILRRSAYVGTIDKEPSVYSQLISPAYQGGRFNRTRSVNQYLTHWIYPYRGKFHPQMVRALLNMLGCRPGSVVLEPFVGSGTAALEASLLGAQVIGVDLSPLCVLLTRVKTLSWTAVEEIRSAVERLLRRDGLHPDNIRRAPRRSQRVTEFLQIARMVTYSDVARRKRQAETAFRRNLAAMLDSVEAHARAVQEFGLTPGDVDVRLGSSCDLASAGVQAESVDIVVTSPPYSIALDYVANDKHALEAMDIDLPSLRERMTGVRGRGPHEKLVLYNEDMRGTFQQVATALKPGGRAAFVIGDATVDKREVTTTDTMADWAEDAGLRKDRTIKKIVFGLYNVMNDEKILTFVKP